MIVLISDEEELTCRVERTGGGVVQPIGAAADFHHVVARLPDQAGRAPRGERPIGVEVEKQDAMVPAVGHGKFADSGMRGQAERRVRAAHRRI